MQFARIGRPRGWPLVLLTVLAGSAQAVDLDTLPEVAFDAFTPMAVEARQPRYFFGYIGGAVFNTGRYLGSDERVTFPFPLLLFDFNDRLYWSISSVGGWLLRSEQRRFKAGVFAKARGAVRGEYTSFEGIEDREATTEAGINLLWRTRPLNVGAAWLYDVGGRSQGQSASLRLSHRFKLGDRWATTPSVSAQWLSHDLVDYYYGVDPRETGGGAPLYEGRGSINLNAVWTASYRVTRHWHLMGGISYSRLGDGLADSPLTERRNNTLVFVGAGWSFLRVHR